MSVEVRGHRVDLALPTAVPVGLLLPSLRGVLGPVADDAVTLRRGDGRTLDGAVTLESAGIVDGDILVVAPAADDRPGPTSDDVAEVVASAGTPGRWSTHDSRVAAGVATVVASLAALAGVLRTGPTGSAPTGLAVAVVLFTAGGLLARIAGDRAAATVAVALGAAWAAGAGALLGGDLPMRLLLAGIALLAAATLVGPVVRGSDVLTFALGGGGALAAVAAGVAVLPRAGPTGVTAAVAVLGLAVTGALPAVALRVVRLPSPGHARSAADLERRTGPVDVGPTRARADRARAVLTGLLVGCLTPVTGAVVLLAGARDPSARALSAVLVALLLLRTRTFRLRAHLLVVVAAAVTAGLGLVAGALAATAPAVSAGAGLGAGAAALAVVRFAGSGQVPPRLRRLADLTESLLNLTVVPVLLSVWGVYGAVLALTRP